MTFPICIWTWRQWQSRIHHSTSNIRNRNSKSNPIESSAFDDTYKLVHDFPSENSDWKLYAMRTPKITNEWLWCDFAFAPCFSGIEGYRLHQRLNSMFYVTLIATPIKRHSRPKTAPSNRNHIFIHFTHTQSISISFKHQGYIRKARKLCLKFRKKKRKNREKKTSKIHTIKLLQIVKSMSSISNGMRVQLCPKRIGYVRRNFIKQIHLYSIGSAKWLEHFSLANWAIRKSAISSFYSVGLFIFSYFFLCVAFADAVAW